MKNTNIILAIIALCSLSQISPLSAMYQQEQAKKMDLLKARNEERRVQELAALKKRMAQLIEQGNTCKTLIGLLSQQKKDAIANGNIELQNKLQDDMEAALSWKSNLMQEMKDVQTQIAKLNQ